MTPRDGRRENGSWPPEPPPCRPGKPATHVEIHPVLDLNTWDHLVISTAAAGLKPWSSRRRPSRPGLQPWWTEWYSP